MVTQTSEDQIRDYIKNTDWRNTQSAFWYDDSGIPSVSHERCRELGFVTRDFAQILGDYTQQFVFVYDRRKNWLFTVEIFGDSDCKSESDKGDVSAG